MSIACAAILVHGRCDLTLIQLLASLLIQTTSFRHVISYCFDAHLVCVISHSSVCGFLIRLALCISFVVIIRAAKIRCQECG